MRVLTFRLSSTRLIVDAWREKDSGRLVSARKLVFARKDEKNINVTPED